MTKRIFLKTSAALALAGVLGTAQAQNTPLKFQLDWRFEGPAALFLTPVAKGYFKDAKLDVTVDAGNGSGGATAANAVCASVVPKPARQLRSGSAPA